MENKKPVQIFTILTFVGIYLFVTGVSFAFFDYIKKPLALRQGQDTQSMEEDEDLLIDVSGPKTESCLLNGKLYTKAEKEVWSTRRPLAVMIENHPEARPQSGLSNADVIYEAVAEGGITRFLVMFYCGAVAKENIIGPVRSARTYFLDFASEYGETPLYIHVGGAHCDPQTGDGCLNGAKADALGQIGTYGWEGENDLNQFSIGFPTFWRDYERIGHTVATEHTMYSTTERLWAMAKKRDWTNEDPDGVDWTENFVPWSFLTEKDDQETGDKTSISFSFWEDYKESAVKWEYDAENRVYKRLNADKVHKDLNTDTQLTTKTVVVQLMKESSANDGYPGNVHLLYGTIGEGKALIFSQGNVEQVKWVKKSRKARTTFYLSSGKEYKFNPGIIWIEIVPLGTEVTY
ncbi:DUF3048 domain-containing protein [Patescibacteria group bacterium]